MGWMDACGGLCKHQWALLGLHAGAEPLSCSFLRQKRDISRHAGFSIRGSSENWFTRRHTVTYGESPTECNQRIAAGLSQRADLWCRGILQVRLSTLCVVLVLWWYRLVSDPVERIVIAGRSASIRQSTYVVRRPFAGRDFRIGSDDGGHEGGYAVRYYFRPVVRQTLRQVAERLRKVPHLPRERTDDTVVVVVVWWYCHVRSRREDPKQWAGPPRPAPGPMDGPLFPWLPGDFVSALLRHSPIQTNAQLPARHPGNV
ncbi:hypothetical protein B0T21DRAFT_437148 [Apiosordaria backusii]|uniref:Uncharacterized protein n=1 Tax=Apiosordaria backusii TaxID=314023 RepID=A0AA40EFM4_9PEZI|nr:hypothetical protein B0T21DRAFT_437148 [Apiosordaria backusii]